ncbi:hypothetical protein [Ornithinimicrobium sp. INDO-MA30-4]|uniref:hypothetical protein n=1 Tax=Ornithinimicrobium sp. INDO-MA30-4 TaxID=2908651 RepID=UPI001F1A74A4|nr:hypothetical protein [Ornithinimicrobium sp. INDO-MA30-4]UJH70072.1 hypothetical protein L0A91_12825 [Ornithinimicrobium sp. INDO-MA30-4]
MLIPMLDALANYGKSGRFYNLNKMGEMILPRSHHQYKCGWPWKRLPGRVLGWRIFGRNAGNSPSERVRVMRWWWLFNAVSLRALSGCGS